MDAISYAHSAKQEQRIKKFINDPDSTSGVVTVPKTIASGENITIPSGRVAVLPNVQIDGTLNVQGDVFIPSGATLSSVVEKVTSTDSAIVRFDGTTGKVQNSGVFIDDSNNITTTGRINSVDSRINGNGFTGVFATDTSGIYTDVGNTNYRIYTGNTERMRIDSNGNVGIGTSGPVGNLDVFKTTSAISYVRTANQTLKLSADDSSGRVDIANAAGAPIGFTIGTTERMRIDSNGNVGIGVTPSAWYSGVKAQQIGSQGSIFQDQNNNVGIGKNTYKSGANTYNYNTNDYASLYYQSQGQHQWYTAPSGTAGNAITWTNAMTLDANGNLLVGVTSDTSTPNNGVSIRNTNGTVGNIGIGHASGTVSGNPYQTFAYAGTQIGSIYQTGTTAVVFSTTSDYRLKENIRPADCKRFMDIKFVDYERIDGRHECGVIAHELQEIYPDLVTGEKDATEIRKVEISPAVEEVKDEDGNIIVEAVEAVYEEQEFPVYQQVNYMGLIARIGTVVQQQAKLIEAMRAEIDELKGIGGAK